MYSFSGAASFGDGPLRAGGIASGDQLGHTTEVLGLAAGYVSDTQISGSMMFAGSSFAALGIDAPENFSVTNGNNTLIYNEGVSAVPIPAELALMLSALAGLGFVSRKRVAA